MTEAGNKFAGRFMFTDKKGDGLDEWLQVYLNSGVQPDWEPKQVTKCDGYLERWNKYQLVRGVPSLVESLHPHHLINKFTIFLNT
jgi:hypothetical protein